MRLWSLHPCYLDTKGLVALWREALLAQKVLAGATRGYRNHPQLERFKRQAEPLAAIAAYLSEVQREATRRGYRFDAGKIAPHGKVPRIKVHDGQIAFELRHLGAKLKARDPAALDRLPAEPETHPLFRVVRGEIEEWEVT
jgi:hypothetical protein